MHSLIHCPKCDKKLQLPDSLAGQEVECPACHTQFVAGETEQAAASKRSPGDVQRSMVQHEDRWDDDHDQEHDTYLDDEFDDYDDDDEYERRRRRRDLVPHRGGLVLTLGISSIASLVLLAICSIFAIPIPLILGPIAWTLGHKDLQEINAGRMDPDGRGTTQAGYICGIIGTAGGLLVLLLACGFGAFIAFMIASNP